MSDHTAERREGERTCPACVMAPVDGECHEHGSEREQLAALKAELAEAKAKIARRINRGIEDMKAEIAALKAELAEARQEIEEDRCENGHHTHAECSEVCQCWGLGKSLMDRKDAEIARLRDALERIAEECDGCAVFGLTSYGENLAWKAVAFIARHALDTRAAERSEGGE